MSESNEQKINSWHMKDGAVIPLEEVRAVYLSENDMTALAFKDGSTRLTHIPFGKTIEALSLYDHNQNTSVVWQTNIEFSRRIVVAYLIMAFLMGASMFFRENDLFLRIVLLVPVVIIFAQGIVINAQWKQAKEGKLFSRNKKEWNRGFILFYWLRMTLTFAIFFALLAYFPSDSALFSLTSMMFFLLASLCWLIRIPKERADLQKFNIENFLQNSSSKEQFTAKIEE